MEKIDREKEKIVAARYEEFTYPPPVEDLAHYINQGQFEIGEPNLYKALYWPASGEVPRNLKILVAGCGTMQAAYYAFTNPGAQVIGIDISSASLGHQAFLKEKHNLENLELRRLSILDVEQLDLGFDLIVSTGVLHHMNSPEKGLLNLKKVLNQDGFLNLMVYGSSLRLGIYMLQEVFRLLGVDGNGQEDTDIVKEILKALPKNHAAARYCESATDLKHDSGLVDTFLHPQDKSYFAEEIFDLLQSVDLGFWSWMDPGRYFHPLMEAKSSKTHDYMAKLDERSSAGVSDRLNQALGTHRFIACHKSQLARKKPVDFDGESWLNLVPVKHFALIIENHGPAEGEIQIKRMGLRMTLPAPFASFLDSFNGALSFSELISQISKIYANNPNLVKNFIKQQLRLGNIMLITKNL